MRWQRALELKQEIAMFLEENHNEDGDLFRDDNFIFKFTYLGEIFEKLSVLNKSMQGPHMHMLHFCLLHFPFLYNLFIIFV